MSITVRYVISTSVLSLTSLVTYLHMLCVGMHSLFSPSYIYLTTTNTDPSWLVDSTQLVDDLNP